MDENRQRLADLVTKRRLALGISERAAADAAGMARNTWSAIEKSSQKLGPHRHAAVERVLRWEPGSVEAVLTGGEPTPAQPVAHSANQDKLVAEVKRIQGLHLDAGTRLALFRALIELYVEAGEITDFGEIAALLAEATKTVETTKTDTEPSRRTAG